DQAAVEHCEFFQHRGQGSVEPFEIFKRKHATGDLTEHGGDAVFLVEKIDAKTGDVRDLVTEIDIARFFKHLDLIFRSDFVEHRLEIVAFQRGIIDTLQFAIDAQNRRVSGRHVKVGRLLFKHQVEKRINFGHKSSLLLPHLNRSGGKSK